MRDNSFGNYSICFLKRRYDQEIKNENKWTKHATQ